MTPAVEVKFCGLTQRADALAAVRLGAHFVGVVFAPGGRRTVAPEDAELLLRDVPATTRRVGVFVDAPVDQMRRCAERAGLHCLQLHGDESSATLRLLRREGRWQLWKAVRPRTAEEFVAALGRYADAVDGLLLDGWSAAARGGTGQAFPWKEIAVHRHLVPASLTLIAAGGLNPTNVAAAIELLRPDVVDVSSGIEHSPGIKDTRAMSDFVDNVGAAAAVPTHPLQGSALC